MIDLVHPVRLAAIEIAADPAALVLAPDERAAVEAHWAGAVSEKPGLWNGSAFLFDDLAIVDGVFRARARPTDYATLLHALRRGFPFGDFAHVFPVPAVTSADGCLLVGRQGAGTANGGLHYPPSGSFDADDRIDGQIDPVANMRRELAEEIGLDMAVLDPDPHWWAIASGERRVALVRRMRARVDAATFLADLAAAAHHDPHGEIEHLRFVPFDDPLALGATVPYVPRLAALLAEEDRGPIEPHRSAP